MRKSTTTEVAVVAIAGSPPEPGRIGGPFRVSAGDPLGGLVDGWVERWTAGDDARFEVAAVELAGRRVELPDYYVVTAAEQVEGGPFDVGVLRRHWYLGFLSGLRPARVAPASDVAEGIRMLGSGPWWPDVAELVAAARLFRADSLAPTVPSPPSASPQPL